MSTSLFLILARSHTKEFYLLMNYTIILPQVRVCIYVCVYVLVCNELKMHFRSCMIFLAKRFSLGELVLFTLNM